jgi:DNA-binding MarR family transcriptional regulator
MLKTTAPRPEKTPEPPHEPLHQTSGSDTWRITHTGRLLGACMRRFDERVLQAMARNLELPLALSNLARRTQVTAAQIHLTRHLALGGSRITTLAERAGLTKQAMSTLVKQCEAWGLVERVDDSRDARAQIVRFTESGQLWLQAFREAVVEAEAELERELGKDVAAVLKLGLEAYGLSHSPASKRLPKIS